MDWVPPQVGTQSSSRPTSYRPTFRCRRMASRPCSESDGGSASIGRLFGQDFVFECIQPAVFEVGPFVRHE